MSRTIHESIESLVQALEGVVRVADDRVEILNADVVRSDLIEQLAWTSTFGTGDVQDSARWLIRKIAFAMGAYPASIQDLYMAFARGEYHNVTTPAINVRGDTVEFAGTIFRAANATGTKQLLFELAKSENGYTQQAPAEFASSIFAAAVKYGYEGPVMVQGDHFQANPKKYAADPVAEIEAVRKHAIAALAAGYGNIDIDCSTLVDYSVSDLREQQYPNSKHTAELTAAIREHQPEGITISVGAEIGEIGTSNSTVEDLIAFHEQYVEELAKYGYNLDGVSKVSVQTGTSHGGVVLPDGTIAEVAVDFDTLGKLSTAAKELGIGGSVQHGASTLPEEAFSKFAQVDAVEVHLATAYQNMYLDSEHFPSELREQIYAHLSEAHASERKEGMSDAQFYYKTRKNCFGPFKREMWSLPDETKAAIYAELQPRFELVMRELNVAGNGELALKYIKPVDVKVPAPAALAEAAR
ncbi:MAG: class II fructose-bisphosphate aldolase [Thermomicrobiales bacterium]|nr:class II fructose-bisphosphate aldolase [Thermomicrobiales bacterium]